MAETKEEPVSLSDLNASIEKLQNIVSEMTKALSNETADLGAAETLLKEWERDIKGLEDNEKKLIKEFNQVMSNLYFLPGYVLAVSSGVSGLLASDPQFCWLFGHVIVVVLIFLVSMWLAIRVAYKQLKILEAKKEDLGGERGRLYHSFVTHLDYFNPLTHSSNLVLKKLESYERESFELDLQAPQYYKYLLLFTICGLVYAVMLLVAGYHVLCGSHSQAIPVEPVPDHLPFSPCSSGLRLHQDM